MKIEINKQMLDCLYRKAEIKFQECINNEENAFLEEEISMSLKSIEVERAGVKIAFYQDFTENCLFEVRLLLHGDVAKKIGEYIYIEDVNGGSMEDNLVFY